jgi:hypothetical protein
VARDYGTVSSAFWTGSTGRSLRSNRDAQVLAIYVMSAPLSHMTGIFYLPMPIMCHDTGLSQEEARAALQWLHEDGFLTYDEEAEYIFVTELARCQIGTTLSTTDKRYKGVLAHLQKAPNGPLLDAFHARYGQDYSLPMGKNGSPKSKKAPKTPSKDPKNTLEVESQAPSRTQEAPSKPLPELVEAPSKPLPESQEARSDQNRTDNTYSSASPPLPSPKASESKVDHKKFLEEWNQAVPISPAREMTEKRMSCLRSRMASPRWKSDYPQALAMVMKSPFLRGETSRGNWKIDIDFFLKPDTVTKILEGKFDPRGSNQSSLPPVIGKTPEELREADQLAWEKLEASRK